MTKVTGQTQDRASAAARRILNGTQNGFRGCVMTKVFIIRGFGKKKDSSGVEIDFDRVQADLIEPAMRACGLTGGTTATEEDSGNIREDMFALILEADVVICDITVHNANVFYELGIRHALRRRHTLLIRGEGSADKTPFDLSTDRYLGYDISEPGSALERLTAALRATLLSNRPTDSPVFLLLPKLSEADPSEVIVVPLDLVEEVERAERAKDPAWLRVIAEDIAGQRYESDALRQVARAQWSLKDLAGACRNWERLRADDDGDIEAHLALSNVYERRYRSEQRESLLASSDQALEKVLAAPRLSSRDRAEALALQARNAKTLWRSRFESLADPAEARKRALDGKALEAYHAYREAFECDLNKFYPGLAALQMGAILSELASSPTWSNLFKGKKKEADRAREDLATEMPALTHVVEAAINRAVAIEEGDEKMWADIAAADLLFLTQPDVEWQADPSAIVQAYVDAIPPSKAWAFDAAGGQLKLFAALGLRAPVVQAVLAAFAREEKPKKKQHLVVFTGHGIDAPDVPPRFPAAAEGRARELIRARLVELQTAAGEAEELTLLASGAPGADVLAHEVARELGLQRRLCLPMPADDVSRQAFGALDDWRARFLAIVEEMKEKRTLQLADHDEPPRWVRSRGIDAWSRGNRWVLQLANTWGADHVTVLALFDGVETNRDGGTAQMVRLAREVGSFVVRVIDSHALLAP